MEFSVIRSNPEGSSLISLSRFVVSDFILAMAGRTQPPGKLTTTRPHLNVKISKRILRFVVDMVNKAWVLPTTMARICLILVIIAVSCTAVEGALSWGTWLGADWKHGEGKMKSEKRTSIRYFFLDSITALLSRLVH